MSTNYLALRNSNLSTFSAVNFTYSSLTGSTITARTATYSTITLASSIVSLGQSTNQTYYGQTNGVYTTGWGSTLNTLTSNVKQVAMGSLGQYQVAVCGASTANSVYVTQNSGQTWSTLSAATGLPTAATTLYTSGAVSATGQYGILATTGGYPYVTSTFGATYANVNPNVPAIYLPFETVPANSSVSQGTSPATLTVVGPPTTVPGFVGTNAIRFANTPGGGSTYATQYIEGSWTASPNFTVSFWFYPLTVNGTQQNIFTSHGTSAGFAITTTNTMQWYASGTNLYNTSFTATANTWYNVTMIYNANSTGYLYINNTLVGTATCPAIPGTSSGYFTIGGKQTTSTPPLGAPNYAFNGYIDDLKIYNSAIAFNPMVPMNYNLTAVSGNGQYMLASVSNGGLFMSSNFGSTWSQVQSVANQGVWTGLCLSHTGQYMLTNGGGGYVIPTLTGLPASGTALTTSPWTVNGVTWIGSASSVHSTLYPITAAFNNYYGSTPPYSWLSGIIYASTSPYQYTGSQSTTILGGVGAVLGEWLTIQSSIPLVMYSYSFACGGFQGLPQTYYIVGSNDNATWYPLQYAVMASNPLNTNFSACTSYLQVNITGTQTLTGTSSANIATTSYSTSTNAYTYFRIIATKLNGFLTGQFELAEWFINFVGGQSYSTNYGNSWVNTTFATGNALAISENGQYAIGANVQTAYIVNNYLAGFSTQSYTSPTLTSINATIVATAISNTGQYMVLVTAGTSNNLYYSVNYGATFLSITLGSAPLVSCSMSYDGSYITAASATTVYTLNSNGTGFSLAVGANAGAANQAQNAIALGNSAGQTNQTANSIILNASGSALNSYSQGFYVAPIATALSCTSQTVAMLGYGTDNQVVQSGITMANSQQVIYGEWVQLQLATAASITSYVLQPRGSFNISSGNDNRSPVSWIIVGSLDGINWIVLDTQINSTAYSGTYTLKSASPIYSYFRMIVTQISSAAICDIGGFILYNNGNPIFTAPTTTSAIAPYTLSGTYNNILLLNSVMVCVVTWSWPTAVNTMGIYNDDTSTFFYPGIIAIVNGYINTANSALGTIFLGFIATVGPNSEYNSSYIATKGTSTIITNPLLQVADLSGNIKFQSSAQYPLDVNGVLRTQQLQFQDGSIQGTASNMQMNWGQLAQTWSKTPCPQAGWYWTAISYSGQYQMAIAAAAGYLYVSSDYGQTWLSITSTQGLSANNIAWQTCAMSSSGQYFGAVAQGNGITGAVYLSSNYGQTWYYVQASNYYIGCIAISSTGQYMIVGPPYSISNYIYISTNYGQSWIQTSQYINGSGIVPEVAISGNGQYMACCAVTVLYISSNYGQTWTATTMGATLPSISYSGQYIVVAQGNPGNIAISSNYGQSFTVNSQYSYTGLTSSASGQYVIAWNNSSGNVYVSRNYGFTFGSAIITGISQMSCMTISGSGQYANTCANPSGYVYTSVVPSYMLGNVGIGTSAPAAQLQIYGSSSNFTTGLFNVVNTSTTPNTSLSVLAPNMIANNGNCILIGQAASNNNSFQLQYNHVGLGSTNNYMWLVPFGNMNTGGTLYMNAYGNVGIGTTAPAYNLDIVGTLRVKGAIMSSVYTTASIANGGTGAVSMVNLELTGPVHLVHVQRTDTGQYYGICIMYNWNPQIQAVSQLLNGGIGLSLSGNNLLITNNTGGNGTFHVYATCFA